MAGHKSAHYLEVPLLYSSNHSFTLAQHTLMILPVPWPFLLAFSEVSVDDVVISTPEMLSSSHYT